MEELLGWAVAAGICYTAYSLIFGSRGGARGGGNTRSSSRVDQSKIDRVLDMFPHLNQRSVRWELERNGASVERAVERALREGGLPEPPASYFPPDAQDFTRATATATPTTTGGGAQTPPVRTATQSPTTANATNVPPPSLIKRLGLNNKLGGEETIRDVKGKGKEIERGEGWASSREEREERLRKRKENLVLEARRKLLEKEQRKKQEQAEQAELISSSSIVEETA